MRLVLVFFILILTTKTYSQTVFTDAFAPDIPTDLQIINDDLYVGTYVGGYVAKMPLNDPTNITIVSDNFPTAGGPWKMDYDPNTNIIYAGVFPGVPGCYQINLNNPLPVDSEFYADFSFFDGLDVENTKLYFSGLDFNGEDGQLYSIDLLTGPSSSDLIYSDPEECIRNVVADNDYIYYGNLDINNNLFSTVYKLDPNDPSPVREYIATVGEGEIQSSLIHGQYLYLGLEFDSNSSKIVRLNLESSDIPIPQEVIVSGLSGGLFGIAISGDNLYITEVGTGRILVLNDPRLALEKSEIAPFTLYPNPTDNALFLKGNIDRNTSYKIFGVGGVKLLQGYYSSDGINLTTLSSGAYFIQFENEMGIQTKKIIKK